MNIDFCCFSKRELCFSSSQLNWSRNLLAWASFICFEDIESILIIIRWISNFWRRSDSAAAALFLLLLLLIVQEVVWFDLLSLIVERCLECVSRLDADVLSSQIILSSLDVLIDEECRLDEGILNVMACLCACLHEHQIVLVSKFLSFLRANFSFSLQIIFISDQHYDHLWVRVVSHIIEPPGQIVEGTSTCDIIDKEGANTASVVASRDRSERFLASCVPNLYFYICILSDCYRFGSKVNTNCQVMSILEPVVNELKQEAWLADTGLADDDVLKDVFVADDRCTASTSWILHSKN